MHSCVLGQRFGFEYLISYRPEHSDADRVIKESKDFFSEID